jgi:hypothetical protein
LICEAAETEQLKFEEMLKHPEEHWYNLNMMGMKVGYMHIFLEKTEYQGEEMLRSRTDTVMQLKGFGKTVKIEINRIEYSDSNFMPRYFVSTSNESGEKKVEGKIKDNIAYMKITLNGETTESEVAVPDNTISDTVAVNYLLSKDQLKIGEKLNYNTFSFDLLQSIKTELKVLDESSLTYDSEEKQVYVLEQKMDIMGGITARLWVTRDGTTYKSATDMMGFSMVATKTDRETALDAVEEVDIMLGTRIIPTGKKLKRGASQLVANVQLSKGSLKEAIMTRNHQKLALNSERSGKLSIEIPKVEDENCVDLPVEDPELQTFLSATAFIEASHPDIRAKAIEILDGEVSSWRAAKKLSKWVYRSIRNKKLSGGFNSSLKTLESFSGDCTEHTVLLIAMARSVGIPARICSGLFFAGDAFYYHFWPEVYVGTWVQMDPTLGQIIADANHIQLGGGTLESDTMTEYTEGVFRTLNQLEIDVVE